MSKPERAKLKVIAWKGRMAPATVTLDLAFDAGSIVVEYEPDALLIDRNAFAVFVADVMSALKEGDAEALVTSIAQEVKDQASPHGLVVTGRFRPLHGVGMTVVAER